MTAIRLNLPTAERRVAPYKLAGTPLAVDKRLPSDFNRSALAAAHLVTDVLAERAPWDTRPAIDWDATLGFREWLIRGWAWPKPWTRHNAEWALTGKPQKS